MKGRHIYASNYSRLAKELGIARSTVMQWVLKPGFPGKTKKGYCVEEILKWRGLSMRRVGENGVKDATDRQRLTRAQADEREAKASIAKIEAKAREGEFVPRAQVLAENVAKFHSIREAFLALPRAAAPALYGMEVEKIEEVLESRVRGILERLCSLKK